MKTHTSDTDLETESPKINQSTSTQLEIRSLNQLKCHLENIIGVGYDIGIYGLYIGATSLRDHLKPKQNYRSFDDRGANDLHEKILSKLNSIIDNSFGNLLEDNRIRFSDKVKKLDKLIKENKHGQCIIFVERVYTAAILYQVLKKIVENSIKIKCLTGSKCYIDGISVSNKYQVESYRK